MSAIKNILAIDTSSDACCVAIITPTNQFEAAEVAPRRHGEILLPTIDSLLQQARLTLTQIDVIAFGKGPGSFTGQRMAASLAQGFAFAINKPLIAVSSMQARAQFLYSKHGYEKIVVALDARIEQIYCGYYQLQHGIMQLQGNEQAITANDFITDSNYNIITGDGWQAYPHLKQQIDDKNLQLVASYPKAIAIAELAIFNLQQGNENHNNPIYLRGTSNWKKLESAPI